MSKFGSAEKIKLNGFDDLFGGDTEQENGSAEKIIIAPLKDLYEFNPIITRKKFLIMASPI